MLISSISVSHAAPARPSPNQYSKMSDSDLAKAFGDNFQAFKHPTTANATTDKIREVAGRSLTGDAQKDNETQLAREVLKRDNVLKALDSVDDNGKRDGVIGPWNPQMAADQLACNRCMSPSVTTVQITY
ncbi:hypothetical protein C4J93_3234 [Pseudomonas sp. R2-37-08W]|uniref:hypothetical protein n=1 Tax=unclassified Pseudomonas TaxID=196821 RepID=UPI000F55E1C2|nr:MULTISPECIES: hypothetical protein [unclassified Pseudomonas]AZF11429.1 hypothetical protein C4J93_3234 [Pseudomonas sp. R2-37-08W]AZF38086.1 hypothetical protein C4J88_3308 [Pseudomonas sp. R4-39-08]AZF58890.1 hypothetical protein C4J84_3016 [Pseudomonas sp. R11-23-07]